MEVGGQYRHKSPSAGLRLGTSPLEAEAETPYFPHAAEIFRMAAAETSLATSMYGCMAL